MQEDPQKSKNPMVEVKKPNGWSSIDPTTYKLHYVLSVVVVLVT